MNEDILDDKLERKAERKRLKKLEELNETGELDPWERYRMLTDILEQYTDIVELADRKTRFALMILGALNAVNLIIVGRPEIISENAIGTVPGLGVYVTVYVMLSLFLFVQAIGALKPRIAGIVVPTEKNGRPDVLGLRFIQNILHGGFDEYYAKWQRAQFSHINRETAMAVRVVADIITLKYKALDRLYAGLLVLVFLTAGLITALVYSRFV
jgi:hypothetical protein